MVRFDAYTATITAAEPRDVLALLSQVGQVETVKHGHGFHTFAQRASVRDGTGTEWASVQWGGSQGDRLMIEVKGEHTPAAAEAIRSTYPGHRVTRVDSCADFDEPGAFERLLKACGHVKAKHRLKGEKQGDWDDYPEDGRTLYLGARSSVTRLRLYEKGKQREYAHLGREHWVRLEVQVRPTKQAREAFSKAGPIEVWGASRWTRDLAAEVLAQHIDPHPAGSTYRLPEREAALRWMCRQYGQHLVSLADDLGGWDVLGYTLRDVIEEVHREKQTRH